MMYYYEHTDGSMHQKPDIVVEMGGGPAEYFASPFVKRWWFGRAQTSPLWTDEIKAAREVIDNESYGYGPSMEQIYRLCDAYDAALEKSSETQEQP